MHPIQAEAKNLGELLKARRDELGLSLKEVENATSIRASYIEAIEEGKIAQFIANIYAMGFIKHYSLFLGMDLEKLKRENPRLFHPQGQKHDFDYGIGTLEYRNSIGSGSKIMPNSLVIVIGAILAIGAFFLARYMGIFS